MNDDHAAFFHDPRRAIGDLYDEHKKMLLGFARKHDTKYERSATELDGLVSIAIVVLQRKVDSKRLTAFTGEGGPIGFLCGIIRNLVKHPPPSNGMEKKRITIANVTDRNLL